MHPNPIYRSDDQATALATARKRGFGVVTTIGPDGILASHLPFVAEATTVDAHVPRSNAIGRFLRDGPQEALLVVSGPDSYVSPDWYGAEDQVPTWNYVAIHIRGTLELRPPETLRPHLEQLSAEFEDRLQPKKPWTMDKNAPDTLDKLLRMLVPLRLTIRTVESTWKLNQNKTDAMRQGAMDGITAAGIGHHPEDIAELMRTWADL